MKRIADISWPSELAPKIEALMEGLRKMDSLVVAYSGGVDSAFLAAVAHEVPGPRVLAVTAVSPSLPAREKKEAKTWARNMGLKHRLIETHEFENPEFVNNSPQRCFHCKRTRFADLCDLARKEGFAHVADGTNADDADDFRPGSDAANELGVRSPLRETGFSKADIRTASHLMGLPSADKPASACLASRVPYGTKLAPEILRAVEQAEDYLHDMGFEQVRVRAHGEIARIELEKKDIPRAATNGMRREIVRHVEECGFRYVVLDLQGYRPGSLNPQ